MDTTIDNDTQEARELLRYRVNLSTDRSRAIYRLKALLNKLSINSNGNFTAPKRQESINLDNVSYIYSRLIKIYLKRISDLSKQLVEIEKEFIKISEKDPNISNLMTIPGVSQFAAVLIKSEVIDIGRFNSFSKLCAYAGLAPGIKHTKSKKPQRGQLNTNKRQKLQSILLENVQNFVKAIPKLQEKYLKLQSRKGNNTAKIALSRDMLKIVYHVLKEKRQFKIDHEH